MAYQCADPAPFAPEGMHYEEVPNRAFMVRAVAPAINEDLAIAIIDPLPGNALNFGAIRGVIRDFL